MSVTVQRLDHVNVRTSNLDGMIAWYGEVLDMHPGPRPAFSFPGAWLYCDGAATIHLVGINAEPGADPKDLKLEHFALRATGYRALLDRAQARGADCKVLRVPGFPIVQINLWDADGNHIHIDFDIEETEFAGT